MKLILSCLGLVMAVVFLVASPSFGQDEKALEACHGHFQKRMENLSLDSFKGGRLSRLNSCVKNLTELYSPDIIADPAVELKQFSCGLWCEVKGGLSLSVLFTVAGKEDYIRIIEERLSPEQLGRIEEAVSGGLSGVVSKAYDDYFEELKQKSRKQRRQRSRNALLQDILGEVAEATFYAEMHHLNLLDTKVVDLDAVSQKLATSMRECVRVSKSPEQLGYCAKLQTSYISLFMGEFILEHYLVDKFYSSIPGDKERDWVKVHGINRYQQCMATHTFALDLDKSNPIKKVQSCVYYGLLQAFVKTSSVVLKKEISALGDKFNNDIDSMLEKQISQCEMGDKIMPKMVDSNYFESLEEWTPNDIEKVVRSCQSRLEQQVVADIAFQSIKNHPAIKELIGSDSEELAKRVMKNHFDYCETQMANQSGRSVKDCGSYLMIQSVFELLDSHAEEKFDEILHKMAKMEVEVEVKKDIISRAKTSMQTCYQNISRMALENPLDEKATEEKIIGCLRFGLVSVISDLAYRVFSKEVAKNETMQRYGIQVGPNKMSQMLSEFDSCFSAKLGSPKGINSLMKSIKPAVETCQVSATSEIGEFVMESVLVQELQKVDLSEKQITTIVDNYKSRPGNVFEKIRTVKTKDELETLSKNADYEVVKGIAKDIIQLILKKEAGKYLSSKELSRFADQANGEFVGCIAVGDISACQKKLTPQFMAKVLRLVIPREAQKYFEKHTAGLISKSQAREINLGQTVSYWITPGKTKLGTKLISYIVDKLKAGSRVDDLLKSSSLRNMAFVILTSSSRFFESFVAAVMQNELNKAKNNPSGLLQQLFVRDYAYNWAEIRKLPEGQAIMDYFKAVFKRIIISDGSMTKSDKDKVTKLASAGVKKLAFSWNAAAKARKKK